LFEGRPSRPPPADRLGPIDAQLAVNPDEDQQRAGHSQGQACDVDKGDHFVSSEIPPSDRQVIFQHRRLPKDAIRDQSGQGEDELDPVGPAGGPGPPNPRLFPEKLVEFGPAALGILVTKKKPDQSSDRAGRLGRDAGRIQDSSLKACPGMPFQSEAWISRTVRSASRPLGVRR
jgi:hypothetical protein